MPTEQEAREKWCPFVRYAVQDGDAFDNRAENGKPNRCIASQCMAWRWGDDNLIGPEGQRASNGLDGQTLRRLIDDKRYRWTPVGYCGLAGEPR